MLFLFEVEVREGYTVEQYAEAWLSASALIQQAIGARGTRLHRKLSDPGRLLVIARWQSKTARETMDGAPRERIGRIIGNRAEFVRVHVIGEFDDAEWSVDPPGPGHAHPD